MRGRRGSAGPPALEEGRRLPGETPLVTFGPETSDVESRLLQIILFAMAPPVLTHELALEIQEKLIGEFMQPAFRYKLRDALDGSEGDIMKQAHARRDVCMAVEIPLLAKYGYDASEEGIHQHSAAMALLLKDCPDLVVKNNELARLALGYESIFMRYLTISVVGTGVVKKFKRISFDAIWSWSFASG
ncbi:hypothetical protein AK812_SmicGene28978 [Symbiodinium microadriaticum]|uniref:Uncharacterized protein n=1 Tax=Symbiodinium microadriaticum TaxID=2951 RepID=A0A1Q9D311_SYMMI|nr:hypothetical protein AK812_SmicGene28978 [Symbiodinium microadriaticum]